MSTHTGLSSQIELAGNTAGITVLVEWVETYNTVTNTSTVAISKLQVKSSIWYSVVYYLNGNISVDGTKVQTFSSAAGTHDVYLDKKNTYANVYCAKLPPWSSAEIKHNDDGTKTVEIAINISGITANGTGGSGWVVDEVVSIALTDIPVPKPDIPDPEPEPEPEPEPDPKPELKEPLMTFYYDSGRVLFPRYEGRIVGFAIIPHGDSDEYSGILGVGVLGKMILGNEV